MSVGVSIMARSGLDNPGNSAHTRATLFLLQFLSRLGSRHLLGGS
jgi:hypothetical protein